ncbi:hypothetical protein ACFPOH_16495 [Ureibacillus suwonensis]|uniref:Uncharacterized protein n=1 Tax=Ureibacillus suwonensis TaxID=313007 RepID=A0ABW0REY8_9BACL
MDRKTTAALSPPRDSETTEELVGVLTAISVVSKRLAKKLALLEQRSAENGGVNDARGKPMSAHAD